MRRYSKAILTVGIAVVGILATTACEPPGNPYDGWGPGYKPNAEQVTKALAQTQDYLNATPGAEAAIEHLPTVAAYMKANHIKPGPQLLGTAGFGNANGAVFLVHDDQVIAYVKAHP